MHGAGRVNPTSANLTKWPNTLKQFVGNLPTNCLSMFGHFVKLVLKGLRAATEPFHVCVNYELPFAVSITSNLVKKHIEFPTCL